MKALTLSFSLLLAASAALQAPAKAQAPHPGLTMANVRYGPHERNVLDFYKVESAQPTPVLFYIHGGGWLNGDKAGVTAIDHYLKSGISVVSINYRYTTQAKAEGVQPPVKASLHDAARALQFVRSKAAEWNIDKTRIAAAGGSAGACTSLWLSFHDDMADPKSSDPIARESTRLLCAGVYVPQTTLDPQQMKEWTPNSTYGAHAFGLDSFDQFLAGRDKILGWIAEYSPYALVTADDSPVYLFYGEAPAIGKEQKDPTHTANFGVKLEEKMKATGVPCELVYPGAPNVKHPGVQDYIIEKLKAPAIK